MVKLNTALFLAAALLLAAPARGSSRLLLADDPNSPVTTDGSAEDVEIELPFVNETTPVLLYPELVPLVEGLQSNDTLMQAILLCSDTVGIPHLASEIASVFYGAAAAFKAYGFCSLNDFEEQQARMTYMIDYAVSLHAKAAFLSDYQCDDLKAMPQECLLSQYIEEAINATTEQLYAPGGFICNDTLPIDATALATEPVYLLTLPDDYVPATPPKYNCVPRTPIDPVSAESEGEIVVAPPAP